MKLEQRAAATAEFEMKLEQRAAATERRQKLCLDLLGHGAAEIDTKALR